ncbi:lactonase [Variovorax sp. YR266]|uniref:SMP-30/gluconolactonase/LRE family protein n=1 Tax=Variovorax sp. YR266 TaxID=1884386 RepID=UPI000894967D|nr:SMP-30/gluconolactonase/LRE family protein [Variovorax sp. YR266]SDZ70356.1 lactonase [Variovorax sp. YR266]
MLKIAPEPSADARLFRTEATRGLAPIPVWEQGLPSATAEPWFQVSEDAMPLEGPAFDRHGNLLFLDIYGGRVLRLSPQRALSTVYTDATLRPTGLALHRDGRIFLAGVGDFQAGRIVAIDPDGRDARTIVPAMAGHVPDDLVFDRHGGFYFTDFRGTATCPTGGVYYVPPDQQTIQPVLPHMSAANGVALSPDGKVLWATEFGAGRLHRADLVDAARLAPFGSTVPYHFTGCAPDSMRADAEGNVYVAMFYQGRVLAFDPHGILIGQILLPGREHGHFLKCTSLAFVPGSPDVVIVSRDVPGGQGAMIFRARALAPGATLFSHQ